MTVYKRKVCIKQHKIVKNKNKYTKTIDLYMICAMINHTFMESVFISRFFLNYLAKSTS